MAVLLVGRAAVAAPTVHVQAQGCAGIDAPEVERLLEIDLGPLAAPRATVHPFQVALACDGARLRMTARDPILGRQLVRDVAIGPPEPGRDRTIALLVSQVFLTAWAEEFLEHPAPPPRPPGAAPPAPPPPAPAAAPAGPTWELEAGAAVRVRDWSAPARGERLALALSRAAGPVRLLATVGFERGSADRTPGAAVWTMGELGAGLGWWSARRGRAAFAAALTGSAVYTQVHGEAAAAATDGGSVRGVLGQLALAAGPRLLWARLRLGADLQLGVAFPGATARVSGDRDVALAGVWAGAGLTVGWGLR